jgi:hypothetical protein
LDDYSKSYSISSDFEKVKRAVFEGKSALKMIEL